MLKRFTGILTVGVLLISAVNFNAFGDDDQRKSIIKSLQNKVELKFGESMWREARADQLVRPGTSIRTGSLAKAELMYPDGTITRIGSRTNLTVLDKDIRAVKLDSGKLWFKVTKKSAGLRIYSPTAVAAITGTEGVAEFGDLTPEKNSANNRLLASADKNFSMIAEGAPGGDFSFALTEGSADVYSGSDANGNPMGNPVNVLAGNEVIFSNNTFQTFQKGIEQIRNENRDVSEPDQNASNNSNNNSSNNSNNNSNNNNNNNNSNNNNNNANNSNNNSGNNSNNTGNNTGNNTDFGNSNANNSNNGNNTGSNSGTGNVSNQSLGPTNTTTENVPNNANKQQDFNNSPTTGNLEIIIK